VTGEDKDVHWREEDPDGLLYLTKYDTVPLMVDALFDAPPDREFTQKELADRADISERSIQNRINILRNLGIIKDVDGTSRFTLDLDREITWLLRELDGVIRQARAGESPKQQRSLDINPPDSDENLDDSDRGPVTDVTDIDNAFQTNDDELVSTPKEVVGVNAD